MAKTNTKHSTTRAAAQDLQIEACKLYSTLTGIPYGSSRDDAVAIKPRQSGQAGVDVVITQWVRDKLIAAGIPDCCECKNTKTWNLQQAILQARANTPKGSNWMLIMKRRSKLKVERIDPVVVMDLKVFMNLINRRI